MNYEIRRFYAPNHGDGNRPWSVVESGVSLEYARAHCRDPESSSTTCSANFIGGDWFDGYAEI